MSRPDDAIDPPNTPPPADGFTPNSEIFTRVGANSQTNTIPTGAMPEPARLPVIPGYEVFRVIGRGGMGIVYLARHLRLNRTVALKMVLGGVAPAAEILARFRTESLAVARLNHPNITQVYDSGEWESCPYLALEYVEGGTLADRLAGVPQVPRGTAELVEVLARAIAHAHQNGIIHRDLKPGNILLEMRNAECGMKNEELPAISTFRNPKITDFGLARWMEGDVGQSATRDGELLGTPCYMAPEQAGGVFREIGPACDIYALGAILYELLTGRPPFQATSAMETVLQVLSHEPVSPRRLQPGVPKDLETICLKCLEKSPAKRYVSADALADDLRRYLDGKPILARPIGPAKRLLKWVRRRPTAAALSAVSILALLVIVAGGAWYNARMSKELKRSEKMFGSSHRLIKWLLEEHTDGLLGLRGSTPVQKKLVAEMLAYLDALSEQMAGHDRVSGDVTIEDIATAYERLSNVQGNPGYYNLGETGEAWASCQKALELRRRVLAARPGDPAARVALAYCLLKVGELHAALGELAAARAAIDEARHQAESALRDGANDPLAKIVAIQIVSDNADLLGQKGNAEGALAGHRDALQRKEELYGSSPSTSNGRFALAAEHSRIGRLLEAGGDLDGARIHYKDALQLARDLVKDRPDDPRSQRELSVALIAYGDLLTSSKYKEVREALESYERALAIRRAQSKADPDGKSGLRDLAISLDRVGQCKQMLKDLAGAADQFQEALEISSQLARDDPDSIENRRNVWLEHGKLGGVLWEAGKRGEAEKHFADKLRLAEELTAQFPLSGRDWEGVAEAHLELAPIPLIDISTTEPLEQSIARYRLAADQYRSSLIAYAKIAELTVLEPRQIDTRERVRKKLETVELAQAKLEALKK